MTAPAARRVIFLDVDGVLNHAEAFKRWKQLFGTNVLDPDCISNLVKLARSTGAEVVLSSTWRLIGNARELIRCVLWTHGVLILDQTPDLFGTTDGTVKPWSPPTRADEIRAWLDANKDVTHFVVIDDDSWADIPGHFVQTDWELGPQGAGLTEAKAEDARRILMGVEPA